MINPYKKNAKLVLSNGIVFPGFFFGASGTAIGEIVFNTGMTGYQEVITDPSYYGQILTFTYPEIGNTGINFEDSESNINVKGIIVRNFSSNNSNWRSKKNFNQWLIEKNIVGLYGIDTRALVKILRSNGSMNGILTSENKTLDTCLKLIYETPKMEGLNLSKEVSTKQQYLWKNKTETDFDVREIYSKKSNKSNKLKIVAIDFGIKKSILNRLVSHGCEVLVLPSRSSLKDVLSNKPDGVFFSNGPGDPATVTDVFHPAATDPLSKKKKAVAANIPIEIIQKDIPTKSSDARRTASAFAAPEKPNRATAANANNLSFFIKNSLFS